MLAWEVAHKKASKKRAGKFWHLRLFSKKLDTKRGCFWWMREVAKKSALSAAKTAEIRERFAGMCFGWLLSQYSL